MTNNAVEILLVEDNSYDVELTLHALDKSHITNHFHIVRDGAEALEFIFCTGTYAERSIQVKGTGWFFRDCSSQQSAVGKG